MPALEETGLISMLDKLVWDQVLSWISDRLAHGRACVPVSINVSRVDVLSFDVADLLSGLLEKYAVPPEKIRVEITESACMESNKAIRKLTERLHEMGVMVHMDDFGTGHKGSTSIAPWPMGNLMPCLMRGSSEVVAFRDALVRMKDSEIE